MAQMTQMTQMGTGIGVMIMLLTASCVTKKVNGPDKRSIGVLHLEATHTEAYCKGVPPRPEDHIAPQPWSTVLYVREAGPVDARGQAKNDPTRPVVDSIRTMDNGQGFLRLPPGSYILVDRDRVDDRRYQQLLKDHAEPVRYRGAIDKDCLDKWLHASYSAFTITKGDSTQVAHNTHLKCSWERVPCAPWQGPLPP